MVNVSGKEMDIGGMTVKQLLDELKYNEKRVAVEINEVIVPKAVYEDTVINDGDRVEIVSFVGGG